MTDWSTGSTTRCSTPRIPIRGNHAPRALLRAGRSKIAKKLAEEAIEVVIDAMNGDRNAVVRESADLLYNLVVVWAASGVRPNEVWKEMERRERLFGIAEKLLKGSMLAKGRAKVAPPSARRQRQRR